MGLRALGFFLFLYIISFLGLMEANLAHFSSDQILLDAGTKVQVMGNSGTIKIIEGLRAGQVYELAGKQSLHKRIADSRLAAPTLAVRNLEKEPKHF